MCGRFNAECAVQGQLMHSERILHSTSIAPCTDQMQTRANGSFTILQRVRWTLHLLVCHMPSSPEGLRDTLADFLLFSRYEQTCSNMHLSFWAVPESVPADALKAAWCPPLHMFEGCESHWTTAVQVQASPSTVATLMLLLKDAQFLDARTDVVRGRFITYNHPLETFPTTQLQIRQEQHGTFHVQV